MFRLISCTLLLAFAPFPVVAQPAPDASDYVRLKGKSRVQARTRLIRDVNGDATYLIVGDSAEVGLSEVLEFQSSGVYYQNFGVTTSNASAPKVEEFLLRRIETGPLDLYVHANRKGRDLDPYVFDYFSINGQRPQVASTSNLRPVLARHPESARLLRRADTWRITQYATLSVGAAFLAYGLLRPYFRKADLTNPDNQLGSSFEINAYQGIGLSIGLLSLVPRQKKIEAWREAVTDYQRR